ncbi:hypothetical protein JTE90_019452 [Oedothorax gibbosus]|uniref:Uncharacterized protein n=1 Tax=Oedothorax gibbosus TaxID=931172 RepID=A0AAV6UWJ8_9ARAC|nr:hypothetical protein JTE90_019452 [Oedothorax gibbosus]
MSEVKKSPLKPPPSPNKALKACLASFDASPKQCYKFTGPSPKDTKCYDLPAKEVPIKRRYDHSIYDSEQKEKDLVVHKRKLADLKSSVLHETVEAGELIEENATEQEKYSPGSNLKRSHSLSSLEDENSKLTPKRKKIHFDSPDSFKSLASLPAHATVPSAESPFFRRKSLPSTPTSVPFRRVRADQTPYSSPWQRPAFSRFTYDSSPLRDLDSESGFVDTHCHLDFLFDRTGYRGTFSEFKEEQEFPRCFRGCLAIFCNPHSFAKKWKWSRFLEENDVWASFGCHPHNAHDYDDQIELALLEALEHPKVRALGEIGLDYSNRNSCQKEKQFDAFRRQLRIARKKNLPVVIHCREANEDGIRIIKEILPSDYPIHLHCFTDTWEWCQLWLEAFPSLCVGLTSVLSFPSAQGVRDVALQLPLHKLLLETDAPYFVPRDSSIPRNTKHSHPGMAIHVAAQVAAIKRIPLEQVLLAARNNTRRIYNI